MAFVNMAPDLRNMFDDLSRRLRRLEQTKRFNIPYVISDPANPQNGDMWYNTTSAQLKVYVGGATKIVTIV